jgi:hypothetical protein
MTQRDDDPLSPTVAKVLDEYLATLHGDGSIDNDAADRLDALLRKGKIPKPEDVDAALSPPAEGDRS